MKFYCEVSISGPGACVYESFPDPANFLRSNGTGSFDSYFKIGLNLINFVISGPYFVNFIGFLSAFAFRII
jgi:hypothetical protein